MACPKIFFDHFYVLSSLGGQGQHNREGLEPVDLSFFHGQTPSRSSLQFDGLFLQFDRPHFSSFERRRCHR